MLPCALFEVWRRWGIGKGVGGTDFENVKLFNTVDSNTM